MDPTTNSQSPAANMVDAEDDLATDPNAPDPALLAAMGFASFGAQPGSKRKLTSNSGFIDPEAKKAQQQEPQGKGANALPLGARRENGAAGAVSPPGSAAGIPSEKPALTFGVLGEGSGVSDQELLALRKGVRDARGDVVVFLPSFVEDPWKGLRGRA